MVVFRTAVSGLDDGSQVIDCLFWAQPARSILTVCLHLQPEHKPMAQPTLGADEGQHEQIEPWYSATTNDYPFKLFRQFSVSFRVGSVITVS